MKRFLSASEKTPRNQESCELGFFISTEMFLGYALILPPGVVGRSKVTLDYLLNCLLLLVYMPPSENILPREIVGHVQLAFWIVHFAHVTPQSIKCLRFWIKLSSA